VQGRGPEAAALAGRPQICAAALSPGPHRALRQPDCQLFWWRAAGGREELPAEAAWAQLGAFLAAAPRLSAGVGDADAAAALLEVRAGGWGGQGRGRGPVRRRSCSACWGPDGGGGWTEGCEPALALALVSCQLLAPVQVRLCSWAPAQSPERRAALQAAVGRMGYPDTLLAAELDAALGQSGLLGGQVGRWVRAALGAQGRAGGDCRAGRAAAAAMPGPAVPGPLSQWPPR
jgi:hypothetical protein